LVSKLFKLNCWKTEYEDKLGISGKEMKLCAKDLYFLMKDLEDSEFSAVT